MLRSHPRGSAATEVALVMTLLACGLIMGYSHLGKGTHRIFTKLTGEGLASSGVQDVSLETSSKISTVSPASVIDNGQDDGPIFIIYLAICGGLGIWGFTAVLAARKRRSRVQFEEEPPEPVAKISELPEALFAKRQDLLHLLEKSLSDLACEAVTVELVMSSRLSIAQPRTTVDELRRRMKEERLRHFLICDGQDNLLGMVSDRDLAKSGATAEAVMSKSPITVGPNTPLISAVTILINRRFSSLPVVEDGKLIGILTTTDILLAMQATLMLLLLHRR